MADGFLGRWARRKEAVRKGDEVPAEPERRVEAKAEAPPPPPRTPEKGQGLFRGTPEASPRGGRGETQAGQLLPPPLGEGRGGGTPAPEPPPTLQDAHALTQDSDFTRFTRPDVPPDVKTAAFKKLFADPHFNVMDGLDVYIDDYSKPDPIPPEMLRNLASAKFLKLFDEEEKQQAEPPTQAPPPSEIAPGPREVADNCAPQNVAQSGSRTEHASTPAEDHADPDLRLQQDDAPGSEGPGAGAR